jgi:hypothetical protein
LAGVLPSEQIEQQIIGTWINEDDTNWQIEFEEGNRAIDRYIGEGNEIFRYLIDNVACDGNISTDQYLKLIHATKGYELCYYIHGITEKEEDGETELYLSIEALNNPRPFLFKKK